MFNNQSGVNHERNRIKNLATCIEKGTNPVEVAGYGRESTHKGYLTWLLNTGHWKDDRKAIDLLIDWPSTKCPEDNDSYQKFAGQWKQNFPSEFWCGFEYPIGNRRRVDLILKSGNGNNLGPPIELKTDGHLGTGQLDTLSSFSKFGLVFLLDSSSIRCDSFHEPSDKIECWKWITINDIRTAWESLYDSMPQPGKDWYGSLKNEALRLNCAFKIENYDRDMYDSKEFGWWKYGYRNLDHLYFSKLNSVREVLHDDKNNELTKWSLYDGGHNAVLNLRECKHSWKDIPNLGKSRYYWEFNDDKLALKVEYTGDKSEDAFRGTKSWISGKKDSLNQTEWSWPDGVTPSRPRARAGTWISVFHWKLTLDSAESVADQVVKIIELVENSKILDN